MHLTADSQAHLHAFSVRFLRVSPPLGAGAAVETKSLRFQLVGNVPGHAHLLALVSAALTYSLFSAPKGGVVQIQG